MNRPSVIDRPRTVSHDGSVPTTVRGPVGRAGHQSSRTPTSSGRPRRCRAPRSSTTARWRRPRSGSTAEPKPPRTPELDVVLPGETVSRLEPSAVISDATCCWAPSPSPTVRITAAIPIMMPSTVRVDRSRWVTTASQRSGRSPATFIGRPTPQRRTRRRRSGRPGSAWSARPNAATSASWVISTMVRPLRWSSSSRSRTSRAETESRLPVGSSARIRSGSVTSAPGHGDTLLLAAGQLPGPVLDPVGEPHPVERGLGAARRRA